MHITRDASKGQLVPFYFGQDALAASQTNVQIPVVMAEASMAVAGYTVPFAYDVVAVSAMLSAAGSAGTLTIGATIGGTEDADTTLTVTTATNPYQRVARGKCSGAAGSELGCEITTDGSWNGTSSDLQVTIWALVYMEGV